MQFPHFLDKYELHGVLKPEDMISLRGKNAKDELRGASAAILCFQSSLLRFLSKEFGGKEVKGFTGNAMVLKKTGYRVIAAKANGLGAPAVAVLLEELAVSGIKSCIAVGVCGAIQDSIVAGDVIILTEAIRDEGTSYHYLTADMPACPSTELLGRLTDVLNKRSHVYTSGKVWTTDAPYRETAEDIKRHQHDGTLAVDMETSAFFCVCSALKIQAACSLVAADSLSGAIWHPPNDIKRVNSSLQQLADAAVEALTL